MSVLKLLGFDVKKANLLVDECREFIVDVRKLLPPIHALVAKAHRIADIILEADDEE